MWDPFAVPRPPPAGDAGGLGGQNPSTASALAPGGESMLSNGLSGVFHTLKRPFTTTAGPAKRHSMDKGQQQQELQRQSAGHARPQPPKSTVPLAGMSVNVGGAASSNALSPFSVQSQASFFDALACLGGNADAVWWLHGGHGVWGGGWGAGGRQQSGVPWFAAVTEPCTEFGAVQAPSQPSPFTQLAPAQPLTVVTQRQAHFGGDHLALTIDEAVPENPESSSRMPPRGLPGAQGESGVEPQQSTALSNMGRFGLRRHMESVMEQSALLTSLVRLRGPPCSHSSLVVHPVPSACCLPAGLPACHPTCLLACLFPRPGS